MRYLITFRSVGESRKRTKRVSQQIGERIVQSFAKNQNIVIDGNWYNVADVENVQKINTDNGFSKDYVEKERRSELANPKEQLYIANQLPEKTIDTSLLL